MGVLPTRFMPLPVVPLSYTLAVESALPSLGNKKTNIHKTRRKDHAAGI